MHLQWRSRSPSCPSLLNCNVLRNRQLKGRPRPKGLTNLLCFKKGAAGRTGQSQTEWIENQSAEKRLPPIKVWIKDATGGNRDSIFPGGSIFVANIPEGYKKELWIHNKAQKSRIKDATEGRKKQIFSLLYTGFSSIKIHGQEYHPWLRDIGTQGRLSLIP